MTIKKVIRDGKLTKKRAKRNNYERGTNTEMRSALNAALKRLDAPKASFYNWEQKRAGNETAKSDQD